MLALENIYKSYNGKLVLEDINLRVPDGSTHALIGSSGSGKTTLLRLTLGLVPFDRGYIRIDGQKILSLARDEWAERLSYVPQDGGLFPHLTARRNITLMAELRGWEKKRITKRLAELQAVMNLDSSLMARYPAELSGGQKQRVALVRAAFLDPKVMLLDEPMGALDPILRRSLQEELKGIFKRLQKTVLVVTHDLAEAVFLADTLSLLHRGKILQTGTYADFVRTPQDPFVEYFINASRTLPEIKV